MDDTDAVDTLTRFGLTTYEARVFLALQKLEGGTASDVAEVTDVPRSQVYGAADELAERGLVDSLRTRPTVYEPVDLETAEERLLEQFESAGRDLFSYLDSVRGAGEGGSEVSEALWMIRGSANINERAAELIADADYRVVYGASRDPMFGPEIERALEDAAGDVTTQVMTTDDGFLEDFADEGMETIHEPPEGIPRSASRVLMIDDDTLLLGMVTDRGTDDEQEVALWSAETTSASVLMRLIVELFQADPISFSG
jgi:sugar-specific transcriptional regulator TrmB